MMYLFLPMLIFLTIFFVDHWFSLI